MDIFDFNLTEEGEPAVVQPHEKSLPPNAEPDHCGNNLGIFVGTDWG